MLLLRQRLVGLGHVVVRCIVPASESGRPTTTICQLSPAAGPLAQVSGVMVEVALQWCGDSFSDNIIG